MDDARAAGVDIFTMGQYLQPTKKHLPVVDFIPPEASSVSAGWAATKASIRSFRARSRAARTTPNKRSNRFCSLASSS